MQTMLQICQEADLPSSVSSINPTNGSMTLIGSLADLPLNTDAMAFAPIPEPSTYGIFAGLACLVGAVVRRRQRTPIG
jgi:hypothetical protein